MTETDDAMKAWLQARSRLSDITRRISTAVRDRPKVKQTDPRWQEYQTRIMLPLIAERREAQRQENIKRGELNAAKQRLQGR